MSARQPEHGVLLRFAIHSNPQPGKLAKKTVCAGLRYSLTALVHHKDIAHLKPPEARDHGVFDPDSGECRLCAWVLLIGKRPASRNRCVQHKWHQYLRPSSRADSNSSIVTVPFLFRRARMFAIALSTSSCRRSTSGTILAMARP